MYVCSVAQSCLTLCSPMDCSLPGSFCPWDYPKNTGVGCHFLLQCNRIDSPEINLCIYGQFPTVEPRIYNEKIGSSINGVGKTGQPHNINNETGLLFYTPDKKQLKMHWSLQYKTWSHKTRRKIGISTLTLVLTVFWIWNQKQSQQKQT